MKRRDFTLAALATAAAAPFDLAQAQAWPDKPVRWVLSQPPGSGPDNVARLLSDRLTKLWGQAVLIDNKPGGQNTIGAQAAARSAPDGNTFYFATTAALVSNVYLFKTLPYDPLKDFVPVAFIAKSPFGVLVEASSPIKSIADLIARAKAAPGKVSIANEGPRTFSGMTARLLNARAAIETNLVAYASVGVAVQDTIGGHVDALVADLASTAALVRQGRLRLLAVTAEKRVSGWDNVPALAESLPGFEMTGWFALVAPAGTPAAAIQRSNQDVNMLLADHDLAERIATIGPLAEGGMSPEQVGDFLRNEHRRWAQTAQQIGLLPE
jgi:tripartite-type tricarboxylate transporter receptor subunit TctC